MLSKQSPFLLFLLRPNPSLRSLARSQRRTKEPMSPAPGKLLSTKPNYPIEKLDRHAPADRPRSGGPGTVWTASQEPGPTLPDSASADLTFNFKESEDWGR